MLTKLFLGVFALALAWLWWRRTSVERGARKRDEALLRELDPVFGLIKECEEGRDVLGLLKGPVCHGGFKRLN